MNKTEHYFWDKESCTVITEQKLPLALVLTESETWILNLNKADFKQPADLTDEERAIICELIYNYRDNLAGGNDEYFNQMQAILEKLQ